MAISAPINKLDPATSYYAHEAEVVDNVYETPYEYHHLMRPYRLQPLAAEAIAPPVYRDAAGRVLEGDPPPDRVATAEYTVRIRPGMFYAPHPCFATNADGTGRYRRLTAADVRGIRTPYDLAEQSTREVTAEDFVRGIRRLADPRLPCPIFPTLRRAILDFDELQQSLSSALEAERTRRRALGPEWEERRRPIVLDYLAFPCRGVEAVDRTTFRIVLKRKYPQIRYWMAMHFFAPIPAEALEFYAEPALVERQMDLNRWPVGSGPFYVRECDPDRRVVLQRNPYYRGGRYPEEGTDEDRAAGFLADAGRSIPMLDRVVIAVEKESIPQWNKFLQGYYDLVYVTPEVFEQTVQFGQAGEPVLSERLQALGVRLYRSVGAVLFGLAFNMADPVIGGLDESRSKLRRAISVALDYQEYLDIFLNGQGCMAQGPIPPGILGYVEGPEGVNRWVDRWDAAQHRPRRRSLDEARQWMAEAGWPGGRGPDGRPLVLYLDHAFGGDPQFVSIFEWMRQRLRLLGIELGERGTDLSRYRDKLERGAVQLFRFGWYADYPDPENFLFLFYGPNAKVRSSGANYANYQNETYDRLFEHMEGMADGPERVTVITNMVEILRRDAPMCWGMHPVFYLLSHRWLYNAKPREMTRNALKYLRVDVEERLRYQTDHNRPVRWPIWILMVLGVAIARPWLLDGRRRKPSHSEATPC